MSIDVSGVFSSYVHSASGASQISGLWSSYVHSASGASQITGLWSSYVHSASGASQVTGLWSSYVHAASGASQITGLWSSYAHSAVLPSVVCPDITGTVANPATFDGSASTSYQYLKWAWTSIPAGSTIYVFPTPMPDNGAATPVNMTDNEALYHFEGNGDDDSGNARNLTLYNTPTYVTGKVGANAINFNGTNQYGEAVIPIGTSGTIATWFYLTGAPTTGDVIAGFGVLTSGTNGTWRSIGWLDYGLCFFGRGSEPGEDIYSWATVGIGQWYHVVVTWDAANLVSCYLNGQLITALTRAGLGAPDTTFSVAGRQNAGTFYNPARLDETAVWSRVLSASEISDLYDLQSGNYTPIPFSDNGASPAGGISMSNNEGLYHFEGNADDSSGNGRNGTVSNAVQVAGKVGANAYEFNGDPATYITLGPVTAYHYTTQPFSIVGWFKPDGSQVAYAPLFSCIGNGGWGTNTRGYWVDQNSSSTNNYRWMIRTGTTSATGSDFTLSANVWQHVAAVRDGANFKIYVNGVLQTSNTLNATINQAGNGSALILGRHGLDYTNQHEWSGVIDEFAIFERALTAQDVDVIYKSQVGEYAALGTTFTFTPDIVGTYTVQLTNTPIGGFAALSTTADAVITLPGGGQPTTWTGFLLGDARGFTGRNLHPTWTPKGGGTKS